MFKKILRRYSWFFNRQFWLFTLLVIVSLLIFLFIPPFNLAVITLFFLLVSLAFFTLVSLFIPKKIALVVSLFLFIIMLMKALHVIDPLNLILLTSFTVALAAFILQ